MADEPQSDAANPQDADDLMGYPTVDELVKAKRSSDVEARRLFEENARLKALMELQAANPRPEVRSRYEQELEGAGVPIDPLEQYVQQKVGQAVQAAFQPVVRQLEGQVQARTHMLSHYGSDYQKFEEDVARHIQSDPELQGRYATMFQSDPVGAVEYAFLKYTEHKRRTSPGGATDDRSQQAQASIPTSKRTERRRPSEVANERVHAAFDAFGKNPNRQNAEAYAKARLRQTISDEHLFGEQLRKPL